MSDQPGRESLEDGLGGSYSIDDEDQLQPEDTLDGDQDPLDRGYTPPDRPRGLQAWGITAEEQRQDETIEQRIRQEVPDPDSAYGAPDNESGLDHVPDRVGGDDPDSIPAEADFVGEPRGRVGRLIAPDQGSGQDEESEAIAIEGRATSADTPEESAMHFVDDGGETDESDADQV